jgi:lysozyme
MRQLSLVPLGAALLLATVGCVGRSGIDIGESASGLSVCAKGTVTKGVDVSHYDGTIDWAAAHGAGVAFAFMKATENTNFVDPQFATNWKGAGANGVIRGAYHFFRPAADATAQADYFVKTAGIPGPGDLPLTIDLEVTDSVAAATVASGALTFLARVEQLTGKKPIVYTSASFLSSIGSPAGFAAYTLWVANWQVSCPKVPSPPWSDWTFWQDSSTATVAGIPATMVDSDQFNGTLSDLQIFVNGTSSGTDGGGSTLDGGAGNDAGGGGSGGGGGGASMDEPDLGKADSPPAGGNAQMGGRGGCSAAGGDRTHPSALFALSLVLAFLLARALRRR